MTDETIRAVFTLWKTKQDAEPSLKMSQEEVDALAPTEYGERCAAFFLELIAELES